MVLGSVSAMLFYAEISDERGRGELPTANPAPPLVATQLEGHTYCGVDPG